MNRPVTNKTMELSDCAASWFFDERYRCWCLEDILYTPAAVCPEYQQLSIFVPEAYLSAPGVINREKFAGKYTASTAPMIFQNNAAGYMQMPHTWLGGPRCTAEEYLKRGMVYITCGCRGRESREGKAPASLIDLKTAIRFLRHNRASIPGSTDRIISIGSSAGGAMSALLGVTGDHPDYLPYLTENRAFPEESDGVFAAQIYCPIIDLEHADLAYEWAFRADDVCEDSPAGPAETRTPMKRALSEQLSRQYADYVNSLALSHPKTGEPLRLENDGRSGGFYDCLMDCLNASATEHLTRMQRGMLAVSPEDYLSGNYHRLVPEPRKHNGPPRPLGELLLRPPAGSPSHTMEPPKVALPGIPKPWLYWDGRQAKLPDLDTYVLEYRRRMKPCTAFDKLTGDSGENQLFGDKDRDRVHFSPAVGKGLAAIAPEFPEAEALAESYTDAGSAELARRVRLLNPMAYIDSGCTQALHYRIRVGAADADTALTVSMTLALRLHNTGHSDTDYAIVWDEPHCEADYPGEIQDWIEKLCE